MLLIPKRVTGIEPNFEVSRYCVNTAQLCAVIHVRCNLSLGGDCGYCAPKRSFLVRICPNTICCWRDERTMISEIRNRFFLFRNWTFSLPDANAQFCACRSTAEAAKTARNQHFVVA